MMCLMYFRIEKGIGLEIDGNNGVCDIYKEEQQDFHHLDQIRASYFPGTLAKGLAGAHFGEKDQTKIRKDWAVEW